MNHFKGSRDAVVGCLGVIVLASLPTLVSAGGMLDPYAAIDLEHNTNVFDLPKNGPSPIGKDGPTFADTFLESRAGLDGNYLLDRQVFFGTAEFRHFDYDKFTILNHNENLFDGGLKYQAGNVVDGLVEYRHEQRMVQFQDLAASTSLIVEKENNATISANVAVTPEWRWENLAKDHDLDSPRTLIPGLSLHEDSLKEGVKYLGVADLSAGLEAQYLEGQYHNDPFALDPNYHQIGAGFAAAYKVSGLTNFTGEVGYTHRTDPSNAGLSGVTGNLGYQHTLSGRTSVNVTVSRALNSYLTTGGNEIDTTAGVILNYQVTYKILLKAGYSYTDSKFPQTPDGPTTLNRIDHFNTANVDLTYQVFHWLSIHPYARYQSRHSNDFIYNFNSNVIGIELVARKWRPTR